MAEEKFKTTLMGGFDKDDVLHQVREMKDAAYAEKSKLIKEKKDQEKVIEDLKRRTERKRKRCKNRERCIKKNSQRWRKKSRKSRDRKRNWSARSVKNIRNISIAMI